VLTLLLCLVPAAPGLARDQDDDPVFRGRRLSEWIELLRGENQEAMRSLALLAAGGSAERPIAVALARSRRAGLIGVELIGPLKSRKVLPAIITALRDDPSELVREGAANSLGRLAPRCLEKMLRFVEAREALVAALRTDRSGAVRQAAAAALGQLAQVKPEEVESAVSVLGAALKDAHAGTSNAAAETLRRMGKEARAAVPELQQAVRDRNADPLTRIPAAQALGLIGSPDALPALAVLKEVLADVKALPDIRRAAAESIGKLGKDADDAIPLLASILTSNAPVEVRRAVAGALDEFGADARPALAALKKALKDDDKFVRCLALHTIGRMGKELGADTRDVVTLLLQALNDNLIEVRVAVLETFGNLGQEALGDDAKAVLERVTALTRDPQKDVREAADNALKKLKTQP
jgi:HEAT repeat protein